jgi:hypothetical protein
LRQRRKTGKNARRAPGKGKASTPIPLPGALPHAQNSPETPAHSRKCLKSLVLGPMAARQPRVLIPDFDSQGATGHPGEGQLGGRRLHGVLVDVGHELRNAAHHIIGQPTEPPSLKRRPDDMPRTPGGPWLDHQSVLEQLPAAVPHENGRLPAVTPKDAKQSRTQIGLI